MTGFFSFEHTMEWKYIILVGDGMGDYPLAELDGKTPLEAANTPCMDQLAACGRLGTVKTIWNLCTSRLCGGRGYGTRNFCSVKSTGTPSLGWLLNSPLRDCLESAGQPVP